jgi:hypothetical protein
MSNLRITEGRLPCGVHFFVTSARNPAKGIEEGTNHVVVIDIEKSPLAELPDEFFSELAAAAVNYGMMAAPKGNFRIVLNGPGIGRRQTKKNPPYVHILFPKGDDRLPFVVDRGRSDDEEDGVRIRA